MKQFYKSLSIQRKLTTLFFICTVIPVIFIFVFGIVSLRDGERKEYNAGAEKRLIGAVSLIDKIIDENILKSENITMSSFIINGLKADYRNDIARVMEYYSELGVFMSGFGLQDNVCIIYPVNDSLPMGKYVNSIDRLKEKTRVWNQLNSALNSELVWDYSHVKDTKDEAGYISFFRRINNYEELLGFFETRIYLKELTYPLRNIAAADGEVMLYTGADGTVFYSNSDDIKSEYDIVHSSKLRDGSIVSCMINTGSVFKSYNLYLVFYFLGFSVLVAVLFFIYKTMVSMVTKDLNNFIGHLQNDDDMGSAEYLSDASGDPDIAIIKHRFNDLLAEKRKMYSDMAEMIRTKKAMELELLQSGINPHLLYNSLSVIKWQMLRLGQSGIAEMIDNMTNYYRSVLAGGNHVITVREELELVERYIKINEFSYENSYRVIKDIDDEVLECPTIKLILQPIVENAILHGLVEKDDADESIIKITIKKSEQNIIFTVEDNGYGMSEEDIRKALDLDRIPKKKGGYGIRNTVKRIKTYYGSECGLNIQSEPGKGTVVTINVINMNRDELKKRLY
ncbi:MAG: histidine kinase [Clostridia bacterium]|nr:histidine kinase [Clostridia bacterium]